jgi:hypothetical protein
MHRPGLALALAISLLCLPATAVAQPGTPPPSDADIEAFLRTARVTKPRTLAKGVTGSVRATLVGDTLTHDAHIQTIDESKPEFRSQKGVEFNFRDSWKFNVAAYRIDRMLGLDLVPVSVERTWQRAPGAFTWWVGDVLMDEGERQAKEIEPPNPACWNDQVRALRLFDLLIDNVDRNMGNMLITKTWRIWAIDHTRAFRRSATPRAIATLRAVDRTILERLKTLEFESLRREVGRYLTTPEIRALLSRRDAIVAHIEALGQAGLYDRRPPAAGCVPAA